MVMGFDTHLAGRLYRFTKAYIVFVCIFHLVLSSMAWSQRPGGLDTALLVSSGSYSWIDGAWELISVQSYEFNDEYLNTESVIRAMPGSDKNDRPLPDPWRQLYEYDGRGNQISIMTQRWIRGHWQNLGIIRPIV